jgi:hypothetical protein
MTAAPPDDAKDERIRLLEYQAEFLRREVEFLSRRHELIIYTVWWRLAAPFRVVEDGLRGVAKNLGRGERPLSRENASPVARPGTVSIEDIAARITRRGQTSN